jgi:hypothetical protein
MPFTPVETLKNGHDPGGISDLAGFPFEGKPRAKHNTQAKKGLYIGK